MADIDLLEAFSAREKAGIWRSAFVFALIVVLAVAIIAYTTIRVQSEVRTAQTAQSLVRKADIDLANLRREYQELQLHLQRSREATQYVTQGINYYHQGKYDAAVRSYDQALRLDPENPYVLNLKGYSLFKERDLVHAVAALRESVMIEPKYAWGYFDLARAQCAAGDLTGARNAVSRALSLRSDLRGIMRSDGEFERLCQPIAEAYR